jgi:inorganic phosphate transporter, PiT family
MIRARRGGGAAAVDAAFGLAVVAALAFAFTNGFHDAANAIATLVATRGASPGAAIA